MKEESILGTIDEYKNRFPHRVHHRINVGDTLYRNLHPGMFVYTIDSLDVDLKIATRNATELEFLSGLAPLHPFNQEAWKTLFIPSRRNEVGKMVCPLSEAVDRKYGECLEKSLLYHLHEQGNEREVYTIWGLLQYNDPSSHQEISAPHAWNIVEREDGMFLVDMHNLIASRYRKDNRACIGEKKVDLIPLMQEISGIKDGRFVLPHFRKWSYRFSQ